MKTNILAVIENAQFYIHFGHFIENFEHDRKWKANLPFPGKKSEEFVTQISGSYATKRHKKRTPYGASFLD